jgi:hypothetical protein
LGEDHHPNEHAIDLLEQIKAHPEMVDRIDFTPLPGGGGIIKASGNSVDPINVIMPDGCPVHKDEVRFWLREQPLNEFGFLYTALFIAGNYARYYPDRWVRDVENSAPIAQAIEELMAIAERRLPWLALNELSRVYHVPEV